MLKIHLQPRFARRLIAIGCLFMLLCSSRVNAQCTTTYTYSIGGLPVNPEDIQPLTLCANRALPFYFAQTTCCRSGIPPRFFWSCGTGTFDGWVNYGDGSAPASTSTQSSHTYSITGNYTVTLTVYTSRDTLEYSIPIIIENCCCQEPQIVATFAHKDKTLEDICANSEVRFSLGSCATENSTSWFPLSGATYAWNFGDGSVSSLEVAPHIYTSTGTYTVSLLFTLPGCDPVTYTKVLNITKVCDPLECKDCLGSFQPTPGNYVISLWVREDVSPLPQTYTNPTVEISFTGDPAYYSFAPNPAKNKIIEGWQRIEETFVVPPAATDIKLHLSNYAGSYDCYFDDIRIFPTDGQMKTYVYDPITLRVTAMLDENNYATFYEYDEEGKLIRVKKETEKGIMTIQESREGNKKQ